WREHCRTVLQGQGLTCAEAGSDQDFLQLLQEQPADVLLIDQPSTRAGLDLCRRLRAQAAIAHLKLILLIPEAEPAEPEGCDREPACDDVVSRQASPSALAQRVRAALRLKEAEERADRLAGHLLATNSQLEQALQQRDD